MLDKLVERFPITTDIIVCVVSLIACAFAGYVFFAIKEYTTDVSAWYWLVLIVLARVVVFLIGAYLVAQTTVLIYCAYIDIDLIRATNQLKKDRETWQAQYQEDMKRIAKMANNYKEYLYEQSQK